MARRLLPPVTLVSRWDGFCLPCGDGTRPLALTWTGRRGLRAWLSGEGWHDGELRLTCACCGGVDVVGWEDEPEDVLLEGPETAVEAGAAALPVTVVRVLDLRTAASAVTAVRESAPAVVVPGVPAQRADAPRLADRRAPAVGTDEADALDLLHLAG